MNIPQRYNELLNQTIELKVFMLSLILYFRSTTGLKFLVELCVTASEVQICATSIPPKRIPIWHDLLEHFERG